VGTTYRFNMGAVLESLHGVVREDDEKPEAEAPVEETQENNLDEDV